MNTTDNIYGDAPVAKDEVTKDDAKKMKTEYDEGTTIDTLAETYGYDAAQVEAAVVVPADETAPVLQADQPVEEKKAK